MWNKLFLFGGLLFIILLLVVFLSKKRLKLEEINIFIILTIENLLSYICEISLQYTITFLGKDNIVSIILSKLYVICIFVWFGIFSIYVFCITAKDKNKYYLKLKNIMYFVIVLGSILIYTLPIEIFYDGKIMYSYGLCTDVLKVSLAVFVFIWLVKLTMNLKLLKSKKFYPIYVVILLLVLNLMIQSMDPSILIATYTMTFTCYIIFHTIENPDMRLLEELHKSKEISDNANEEKTLFIYNLTQDIRNISGAIDDDADYILDSKNWDETYECARNIKYNTAKFITMTNDILDISTIDSANIKTYNSKYNVKNILKQIINVYSGECESKKIKFNTNIDHDVPEELYGDGIGLKGVLNIILSNSINYTEKGYIELSVNTIIKNNVCRLIFTIEDSGVGIKSEDIEKIKTDNTSLSKANKLISLMGGTMMISSEYGEGTKLKVVLDQKIEQAKNIEVDKYEEILDDIKVLAVDDSEAGLKIIEKLLKGSKVILTKVNTGKECIDKIKTGKYDLILLDEELSQITANELIVKIKEIRNFDTPVVLLTKDNSYEYNDEYIKNGFAGYILKPLKKEKLLEEINNFVRKGNLK